MNKYFKLMCAFILGLFASGIIYAYTYNADEIEFIPKDSSWNPGNVSKALEDLYNNQKEDLEVCKFIDDTFGNYGEVGSKYECNLGNNEKHNFYLLAINPNNYELIMEKNISETSSTKTMTWSSAMDYINNNDLKNKWSNVIDIDLPSAESIANASGNKTWKYASSNIKNWFYIDTEEGKQSITHNATNLSSNRWLYNYTSECQNSGCDSSTSQGIVSGGYWTRDIVSNQTDSISRAWRVAHDASLFPNEIDNSQYHGVRPVITILKTNIYR